MVHKSQVIFYSMHHRNWTIRFNSFFVFSKPACCCSVTSYEPDSETVSAQIDRFAWNFSEQTRNSSACKYRVTNRENFQWTPVSVSNFEEDLPRSSPCCLPFWFRTTWSRRWKMNRSHTPDMGRIRQKSLPKTIFMGLFIDELISSLIYLSGTSFIAKFRWSSPFSWRLFKNSKSRNPRRIYEGKPKNQNRD